MEKEFDYTFSMDQFPEIKELTAIKKFEIELGITNQYIGLPWDKPKDKAHLWGILPKKVIYRDKYTIVIWEDNTKTIVKCSNLDEFDKEKGFLMALTTRMYSKPVMNYLRKEFCEKVEKDG